MKKFLLTSFSLTILTTSTLAADLPSRKAEIAPLQSPPIWTGFYAGLNAGGSWANSNSFNTKIADIDFENIAPLPSVSSPGAAGFIGGGQLGYNWQAAIGSYNFVAGVEADIQGITSNGGKAVGLSSFEPASQTVVTPNAGFVVYNNLNPQTVSKSLNYIGTARGRLGFLAMPTLLVYGTGGLAYGGASVSSSFYNGVNSSAYDLNGNLLGSISALSFGQGSTSATFIGWSAGGGLEWMFMPNWSVKAEYLYYDLGTRSGNYAGYRNDINGNLIYTDVIRYSTQLNGNIARAGINYHFNFGAFPVVSKF